MRDNAGIRDAGSPTRSCERGKRVNETERSRVGAALVAVVEARVDAAPCDARKEAELPASHHLQAARPLPPVTLSRR